MSYYVNLYMSRNMYNELLDAVADAVKIKSNFYEIADLIHLFDALEELYAEDAAKQNREFKRWMKFDELFKNKEPYHHEYFYKVQNIFDEYLDSDLIEWNMNEEDMFHLVCEIIDVFIKEKDNK